MSLKNIAIGFDQLCNTIVGGTPDETLSARAWRLRDKERRWGIARYVIDTIFFFDKNHCELSYISEALRKQLPSEYRRISQYEQEIP